MNLLIYLLACIGAGFLIGLVCIAVWIGLLLTTDDSLKPRRRWMK